MFHKSLFPLFCLTIGIASFGCEDPAAYSNNPAIDAPMGGQVSLAQSGGATTVNTVPATGGVINTAATTTTPISTGAGGRIGTGGTTTVVSTVVPVGIGTGGTMKTSSSQTTKPTSTGGSMSLGGTSGTGGTVSGNCTVSDVIRLVGNKIYDTSGVPFAARGPELVVASTDQTKSIDAIAATGANALRMLFTLDAANGMTPAGFDTLVAKAVSHNMIVWISLYSWDKAKNFVISSALGGGNLYTLSAPPGLTACSLDAGSTCYLAVWSRQWLKDLVAKYKGHVIIDAMQEFIGGSDAEAGRVAWANAAKVNIAFFRGAGYVEPLEIMSNFQGRDLYAIIEKGVEIRAVDTVKVSADPQTMFGWQAYWADDWYKTWQGGLLLGGKGNITGTQAIHQFATTQTFPIEVGIDNYDGDTKGEYQSEIDQASSDRVSWLWWSWKDGDNNVECPTTGAACQAYVAKSTNGFVGAVRSACGL